MAKAFAKKLYNSKEWQHVREQAMIRDKRLCQTPGCYNMAEEVHHIEHLTPQNIDDVEVTLNLDNLTCLCRECHMRIHDNDRHKTKSSEILTEIEFIDGVPVVPPSKSTGGENP